MTRLINDIYAVEVPEDLQWRKPEYHFQPSIDDLMNERKGNSELIICFERKTCGLPRTKLSAKLPEPGNWQLICTTKEVNDEEAKGIVERTHPGGFGRSGEEFKNYLKASPLCFNSIDSLRSLLTSKGLDINKNYVLIKKVS